MLMNIDVYVVTDRGLAGGRDLVEIVEESLQGGAGIIQLREKEISTRHFLELARELKTVVDRYEDRLLIINDRLDIALAAGAHGVHLGQDDMPLPVAREVLGTEAIIGVSVSTVEEARAAEAAGADYLGASAVFGTPTKEDAAPIGLEGVRRITAAVDVPVVAIGGIHRDNAGEVIAAGAHGVAVVSEVMTAAEPWQAVKILRERVNKAKRGEN